MFLLYPLSVSILLPADHANNAINRFDPSGGLRHVDIPHFLAAYLLHDPSCRNDSINAFNPLRILALTYEKKAVIASSSKKGQGTQCSLPPANISFPSAGRPARQADRGCSVPVWPTYQ